MLTEMENVKIANIVHGISKKNYQCSAAATHIMMYRLSGRCDYFFRGRTICLKEGNLLFIPQGTAYESRQISPGESLFIRATFTADMPDTAPVLFCPGKGSYLGEYFEAAAKCERAKTPDNAYLQAAYFFRILAAVAKEAVDSGGNRLSRIDASVEYLENHIFDPDFNAGALHEHSGVSDTYFRRLFISRFGCAPKKYVTDRRLEYAKLLFDENCYDTVYSVALACGYEDALYFSRLFKTRYGLSPRAYARSRG